MQGRGDAPITAVPTEQSDRTIEDGGPEPSRKIFFGWYLVAAGCAIQILNGALLQQTFGAYAARLSEDFGWSRGSISIAYSFSRVESGVLGPLQGWLIDRFGPAVILRLGLVMFAVGFMAFSQINSLLMFYVTFGLVAVGANLGGFMAITIATVNWFDIFRSRAIGIATAGMAIGGLIAPVVILAITRIGWRETAFASGVLILVVGLPLTLFVRRQPSDMGLHRDGLDPEEAARRLAETHQRNAISEIDFTAREAMRTRAFWMVSFGHSTALLVVGAVAVHLFLHLTLSYGYSDAEAAAFIFLMTAMLVAGQFGGGYLGDIFNKRLLAIICMAMHAVALLLVAYSGSVPAIIGFSVLHGVAWGVRSPLMQAIRADFFGRTSFGTIMGFSSMIQMLGIVVGPILAGVLYDVTGSYRLGFTLIAILAALGSIFFILATPPKPPRRPGEVDLAAGSEPGPATA